MPVTVKLIFFILIIMSLQNKSILYDFSKVNSIQDWQIVNDGVMGGLSKSKISLTKDGHGNFEGHVSLENNGGFASVRLLTNTQIKPSQNHIVLKLKGDEKTYQFRLKAERNQRQSYVQEFGTNGEWQEIKLPIKNFSPQYRGRSLEIPNFNFKEIEEIRFLIANKKEEDFKLLIDTVELE
jgi:hypothetical protein